MSSQVKLAQFRTTSWEDSVQKNKEYAQRPHSTCAKVSALVLSLRLRLLGTVYSAVSSVRYFSNVTFRIIKYPNTPFFLSHGKAVAAICVPMFMKSVYNSLFVDLPNAKTFSELVDTILNTISDTGFIGDSISTCASGLESIGLVAAKSVAWATPLLVGCLVLEVAGVIFGWKAATETVQLYNKFHQKAALDKKVDDYTLEDYQKAVRYLEKRGEKESTFYGKFFGLDKEKFADRLIDIEFEARAKIAAGQDKDAKVLLYQTIKTVNNFVISRTISSGMSAVSATSGLSGVSIAMTFPPVAVVGYSLLTFAAVTSLVRCGYDLVNKYKMENAMKFDEARPEFHGFLPSRVKA